MSLAQSFLGGLQTGNQMQQLEQQQQQFDLTRADQRNKVVFDTANSSLAEMTKAISELRKNSLSNDPRAQQAQANLIKGYGIEVARMADTLKMFGDTETAKLLELGFERASQQALSAPTADQLAAVAGSAAAAEEQTAAAALGIEPPSAFGQRMEQANLGLRQEELELSRQREQRIAASEAEGGGELFGGSLAGKSLQLMVDLAPAFAAGLTSPAQERALQAAIVEYTQPVQFANPDTGLMETRRPELPAFVQEALQMRGLGGARPGGGGDPIEEEAEPVGPAGPTGAAATAPAAPTTEAGPAPSAVGTIWGLASDITGPVPAIAETARQIPGVGAGLPGASRFVQARQTATLATRDLVRVLQNNPRYAEGERKAIEEEVNLEGKIFDTPEAFRDRLLALDSFMDVREKNAARIISGASGPVSKEERQQAMNVLAAIRNFRVTLGVPIRVKSRAEVDALISSGDLKKGDVFIDPKGLERQVP